MTVAAPLHFWTGEKRKPLLLIHGFAGHGSSWKRFTRLLPLSWDPVSLTLPGHDRSAPLPDGASFEQSVERIADLLGENLDAPFPVIGYSLGARVALALLVRRPHLFQSALLAGVNPGIDDGGERTKRAARDAGWGNLLRSEGIEAFVDRWEGLPLFATQASLPPDLLEEQRATRLGHDPEGLARSMLALGLAAMPDYRPALGGIDIPIRLVAGEKDDKFLAIARSMLSRLKRGRLTVVSGAGHNVLLERPESLLPDDGPDV